MKSPARTGRRRPFRDESGTTAIVVAVSLFALFGAIMVSVDSGTVWTIRRDLITGTDAAALAAAQHFAKQPTDACLNTSAGKAVAESALDDNDTEAVMLDFVVEPYKNDCTQEAGHVRVDADRQAPLAFRPMFGSKDVRPFSSSTALWGPLVSAIGLRPIGICNNDPHFQEWVAIGKTPAYDRDLLVDDPLTKIIEHPNDPTHRMYPGAGVVHRVVMWKHLLASCGTSPGNWGWLDFTPTGGGANELEDWLRDGYDGEVSLGGPGSGDEDCAPEDTTEDRCGPHSGAKASVEKALDTLKCAPNTPTDQCKTFLVLVYDEANGTGATTRYHPHSFLAVVLRDHNKTTGHPCDESDPKVKADPNNQCPWFDFEFVDATFEGKVGPDPNPAVPSVLGIYLCGVDRDAVPHRCEV